MPSSNGLIVGALVLALRHATPVATRLRGAALGSAAGVWAGLTVFVFCPSGDPQPSSARAAEREGSLRRRGQDERRAANTSS
jgi:hypothetical protein